MEVGMMDELNLDQDFLTRFSCMGTQDKDVLVSQLHGLLDSQLSREGCAFFLDMTNWNLQAAVGAFYDHYSQEGGALPDIALVTRVVEDVGALDLRVPVPGGSVVTETWTLRNTGSTVWPLGVHLTLKEGQEMCSASRVHLPSLSPGQETCAVMEVHTPHSPGQHQCMWRATLPGGALFGEPMWITVHVQEDEGVSGLVQQLSTFSTGDTSGPCLTEDVGSRHSPVNNPFGSSAAFHQYPGLTSSPQSTEDHVLPTVASSCPTLHSSPLSHHSSPNNLHFSPGSSVTTALGVPFITENNLSPLYLNSRQPVSLMEPTDVATPMTHPHKDDQSNQS